MGGWVGEIERERGEGERVGRERGVCVCVEVGGVEELDFNIPSNSIEREGGKRSGGGGGGKRQREGGR